MKLLKPTYYIPLIIILILIATNPSRTSFVSYLHQVDYRRTGRDFNGLAFSIYSKKIFTVSGKSHANHYLGILGNFIKVGEHRKEDGGGESLNF